MEDLTFPPSVDLGLPTPGFGPDSLLAFRPSPAKCYQASSPLHVSVPGSAVPGLLRIQPYLKYPGFDLPELVITEENKGLAVVLRTNYDLTEPGKPNSPVPTVEMPKYVSLQVEGVIGVAARILCANKDLRPTMPAMWHKVQHILGKRDPAWKTEVLPMQIHGLVKLYAAARKEYLKDVSNAKMPLVADMKYWRLLRTVDRWISVSKDGYLFSDGLRYRAKDRWMRFHRVHKKPLPRKVVATKKSLLLPLTPIKSDSPEPGEILE